MQVQVKIGAPKSEYTELVLVGLVQSDTSFTGELAALDRALDGQLHELVSGGDFRGRVEQTAVLYPRGRISAKRLMLVGLGEPDKLTLQVIRQASASAARAVRALGVTHYHAALLGLGHCDCEPADLAQAIAEGALLGAYQFFGLKTDKDPNDVALQSLTILAAAEMADAVRAGAAAGQAIAKAIALARDLANQPGNVVTPQALARTAQEVAKTHNLRCEVLEPAEMSRLGMGALLAVAQGSREPARFVVLEHNADCGDLPTYVVVGKGITFDAGGISIKPSDGMERMKDDMSGAAVALATLQAAADLQIPLHIVGLIPATENLPGGQAYKPGDVLKSMSGLTIEVISTDAEGRLILADALAYAKRYSPKAVVDVATLTGACVIALGNHIAGLMGNDAALNQALREASAEVGESIWELPLYADYREQIKSAVADVKNTGGRPAGTITAGLFLEKFAQDYAWAHLDIAGTAWAEDTKGYVVKGATGFGARLLIAWLRSVAK